MKHSIPIDEVGAHGPAMATAVQACVHCGFCLPTCPTYQVLGEEMDSPRGRITLMKQVLEKDLPLAEALPHVDACLGCLACETSCPSGVKYRELISPFRAWAEPQRTRSRQERWHRWILLRVLPFPRRLRLALRVGLLARPFRRVLPEWMKPMFALLPRRLPKPQKVLQYYPAIGPQRARVALLSGCAQQVLGPEIQAAAIHLLQHQGVEVIVPPAQGCCGALAWHVGDEPAAKACADINLKAFNMDDVDAILTTAAGCGSALHEYPMISGSDSAQAFASKVRDVAEFIDHLGLRVPSGVSRQTKVAMQDACHLLHGQGVHGAPRRLLASIPGVTLCDLADPEICCGSAGTYNLDHPEVAGELGRRKAASIVATGADVCVTGNIGCLMQLRAHLPKEVRAVHTIVLLDELLA